MKVQTIKFNDFMSKSYRYEPRKISTPIYSFGFTWAGFFNMSPEIAGAYWLVSAVGLTAIISNLLENHFASKGASQAAELIAGAANVLMPVTFFGFLVAFLWRLVG
jgi:hypothetical protein